MYIDVKPCKTCFFQTNFASYLDSFSEVFSLEIHPKIVSFWTKVMYYNPKSKTFENRRVPETLTDEIWARKFSQ